MSSIQENELQAIETKKRKLEKELKIKVSNQKRQQQFRKDRREKLNSIVDENPELAKTLKLRGKIGKPRIETDQPELLNAIIKIALHGSAAHEKRRSEVYRSIKTLTELKESLNNDGFSISRSGLYLRLLPHRSNTIEGKRHVSTVPVKLLRTTNDYHKKHIDTNFCFATIRALEKIATVFGPKQVLFLSQDDKSRVPLGLAAANKQSPMLMHMEYLVKLPDHDWVVAARHKLIPSVYAGIVLKDNEIGKAESVGYSGPTYIAIRSGKHSSSTAYSHGMDFKKLLTIDAFNNLTKFEGNVKPIVIIISDGGPDENPRYQKVRLDYLLI